MSQVSNYNFNDSKLVMIEAIDTNFIDPFEEALAYEVLWTLDGMTEKKLSELFNQYDALPSSVLNNIIGMLPDQSVKDHINEVRSFLTGKLKDVGISIYRDFQYPQNLRKAQNPIELFYYKGNLDLISSPSISIVGARKVSDDGKRRAQKLSAQLVEAGFTIVSGLAAGVDTAAHNAAIKTGGNTIGVIGTPIDEYYPKENKSLQDTISKDYLLISQVPFFRHKVEHFKAHKNNFPRRNKTMAALSEATVIVEASDTSGSLTQARACIHQGKKLFILSSCFENKSISWPDYYLKKGAIRVETVEDILKHVKVPNLEKIEE